MSPFVEARRTTGETIKIINNEVESKVLQ